MKLRHTVSTERTREDLAQHGLFLESVIRAHWEKYASENFTESSVVSRQVSHPGNRSLFFSLQFSPEREAFLREGKHHIDPANPFATTLSKSDNIRIPRFVVSKNLFPWQKYQVIIISKRRKVLFDERDLALLLRFSRETSYEIIYNMEGSGASASSHCHFQGFIESFPVNGSSVVPIDAARSVELSRLTFPAYGLRFAGPAIGVSSVVMEFLDLLLCPYNLLISRGMVNVVPRSKAIPEGFGEWDFGAAEVSGLFFPRSLDQFRQLSFPVLQRALEDTTFCARRDWEDIEHSARKAVRKKVASRNFA
jgi:hypothetical protein